MSKPSHRSHRVLILGLAACCLHHAPSAPVRGPAAAQELLASAPCSPVVTRTIDPLVVAEGGGVGVTTTVDYTCPEGQFKSNILFLQNGVPNGSGEGSEVPINENLRSSILGFLDLVDPDKGSRAAFSAFTDTHVNQIPLSAFSDWPTRWGAWSASGLQTHGLLTALADIGSQLPADPGREGAKNIVIAVVTSDQPIGTTTQIESACKALQATDTRLALIDMQQMRGSGGLGDLTCINWYFRSLDGEGRDLPSLFMDIADAVLFTPEVQSVEIVDAMTDAFEYVPRSASPRGPDTDFGNDVTWMFEPGPDRPLTLTYRVKTTYGWSAVRVPVSTESRATFTYSDRSQVIRDLPNPPVCIHPLNNPAFCGGGGGDFRSFMPALWNRGG